MEAQNAFCLQGKRIDPGKENNLLQCDGLLRHGWARGREVTAVAAVVVVAVGVG